MKDMIFGLPVRFVFTAAVLATAIVTSTTFIGFVAIKQSILDELDARLSAVAETEALDTLARTLTSMSFQMSRSDKLFVEAKARLERMEGATGSDSLRRSRELFELMRRSAEPGVVPCDRDVSADPKVAQDRKDLERVLDDFESYSHSEGNTKRRGMSLIMEGIVRTKLRWHCYDDRAVSVLRRAEETLRGTDVSFGALYNALGIQQIDLAAKQVEAGDRQLAYETVREGIRYYELQNAIDRTHMSWLREFNNKGDAVALALEWMIEEPETGEEAREAVPAIKEVTIRDYLSVARGLATALDDPTPYVTSLELMSLTMEWNSLNPRKPLPGQSLQAARRMFEGLGASTFCCGFSGIEACRERIESDRRFSFLLSKEPQFLELVKPCH